MPEQKAITYHLFYQSPVGWLKIETTRSGVICVWFMNTPPDIKDEPNDLTQETQKQLQEYFTNERTHFDLPLEMIGTAFQKTVWKELLNIPFGRTISYLELSKRIGNVKAIRAAGHANGQNPLPIIVPCHRVIGSDGSLTGYGGGLHRKRWLLRHEGIPVQSEFSF